MEKDCEIIKTHDLVKTAQLRVGEISLHKYGFIVTRLNDDCIIDVKDVIEIAKATVNVAGKIGKPVLVLSGLRVDVTKEAREYPIETSVEIPHVAKAEAIVVKDPATRIAAHFYYMFRKPGHPNKVFSNTHDALNWLKTYL